MMRRLLIALLALGVLTAACSSDATPTTTTENVAPVATTTTAAPTTTVATTTVPPTTTTEAPPAATPVDASSVVGVLLPYSAGGAELFDEGSVEAHWYQWQGFYVVLFRGFDASSGTEICSGSSVNPGTGWIHISNAPHIGDADAICVGATIATPPAGVYACESLLYYVTEIPTDQDGMLFGTLEIGDGGWNGQTSSVQADLAGTPEFEPGLDAYKLPKSDVDDDRTVTCG